MKRQLDHDKRDAILKGLLELVNQEGFLGVSMDLLAKKAGISAGSIYYYFESKDAVILHLYQELREKIDQEMFHLKEIQAVNYETQFRELFVRLCHYLIRHQQYFVFMDRFYASPYPQLNQCQDIQFQENNFAAFFELGIQEKLIRPYNIHLIASLFMGTVTISIKKHILEVFPLEEEDMRNLATVLWEGLKEK
ncbi:TetR/AcrR family transcriptional regulator [Olivibacter sitiensis]|uniref:TetR/AcrR family transcriptional regulator n=1 Tax=Olivibacter sitiensis TaxID=376470 RepID=UPI00041D435C|nr:TetR/AcrR family transcriptional regulator [Olivibacter sitiensis]